MYGEPTPGETLNETIGQLAAAREHHRAQRSDGRAAQSGDAEPAAGPVVPQPADENR